MKVQHREKVAKKNVKNKTNLSTKALSNVDLISSYSNKDSIIHITIEKQ